MPTPNPFTRGDRVLASRAQDGANHEEGTVVDQYNLLIGEEDRPMVVVQFEDGQRVWLTANGPDVMPAPEPEDGEADGGEPEAGG